jgi:hypothetical protein
MSLSSKKVLDTSFASAGALRGSAFAGQESEWTTGAGWKEFPLGRNEEDG